MAFTYKGSDTEQYVNASYTQFDLTFVNITPAPGDLLVVGIAHTSDALPDLVQDNTGTPLNLIHHYMNPDAAGDSSLPSGGMYSKIATGNETLLTAIFSVGVRGQICANCFSVAPGATPKLFSLALDETYRSTPTQVQPTGQLSAFEGLALYAAAVGTCRRWLATKTSLDRGIITGTVPSAHSSVGGLMGYELMGPNPGLVEATWSTNDGIVDSESVGFSACYFEDSGQSPPIAVFDFLGGKHSTRGARADIYHYGASKTATLQAGRLNVHGGSATFSLASPSGGIYTYPLTEGSGSDVRCLEDPARDGTVNDPSAWGATSSNDRWYTLDEGTGATLRDSIGGHDATVQNHTEDSWG
jgi:hypothetical protein